MEAERIRESRRMWVRLGGAALLLVVVVASCDSGDGGDPGRLCEIVEAYAGGRIGDSFTYSQFESDLEEAVAVAPSEARAAAEDSLSVARDFTAFTRGEESPDEEAWAALVDRGEKALDELAEWSADNCSPAS